MTWKLSYLEEKRLLIRTVFVLTSLTLRTERSTQSSIAQEARVSFVAHFLVSAPFITTSKWKWTFEFVESIGGNDELNIHRWKEYNVTLEFRAWLGYFYIINFYFHCLKLLFNVLPVPVRKVRKYGQVRKQGSNSVALCAWVLRRTGAITHDFSGAQPKIQSPMRPVSR